jgi:hypothetical protein
VLLLALLLPSKIIDLGGLRFGWSSPEPPIGIEPMTYSLRGCLGARGNLLRCRSPKLRVSVSSHRNL